MSEPMTEDDLAAIEGMLSAGAIEVRYGREYDPSIVRALVAEVCRLQGERGEARSTARNFMLELNKTKSEVRRLRGGIRRKAEAWDREDPDALAFRVTADFRTLIGDDDA